ncbi:hypothetical protein Tco_1548490 [Tanacetum coccineum]
MHCLLPECLEKDICSIVLTSDSVVRLCEDLRSACDRTDECIDTSSASNAIFEINKLRDQLQGKDTTIRNLDAQINIMKVLNVGSTKGSCDQQALETDRIQLKDTITSLRIQLDGLKVENVSLKRRPATAHLANLCLIAHAEPSYLAPNKSCREPRRAAEYNRKLNVVDHISCLRPQWKTHWRHFALYDTCPLTRIMEPIVEPLELTPSVSSSSKVSMISRFTDCKLSDRKAGSKGLSGIFEC